MGIFTPLVTVIKTVVQGIGNLTAVEMFARLAIMVPELVTNITRLVKRGKSKDELREIIDSGLAEFDAVTGKEGLSVIKGMPVEAQERALDHFKLFVKEILYWQAGIGEEYEPTD